MAHCEMCGAEHASLTKVKIEGATLQLCEQCKGFGTEVREPAETAATTSKYSTGRSTTTASDTSTENASPRTRRDMFDTMPEIATDYDEQIRGAREGLGLSQEELADQLNEKASLIRKLERGSMLPDDRVRKKLERALDISLLEGGGEVETDWSGSASTTTTLGDVVKRGD
jgi:transcriptional regulator, XRE family